jgi:hypothetical protein
MIIIVILIALVSSALAGLIMGLLGGGIGLVLVPLCVWLLNIMEVPGELTMHLAVSTSVATIMVVGAFASYRYHKAGKVNWPMVKLMTGGAIMGAISGALVAKYLPSNLIMLMFAAITVLVALQLWHSLKPNESVMLVSASLRKFIIIIASLLIGFIGSVLGANPFSVPLLTNLNCEIHEAIAITVVVGTIMAIVGVMVFIITCGAEAGLPTYTTGYVVWSLVLPLALGSCLFVPLGVKLAGFFSKKILTQLYICLLLGIALKMVLASF